MSHFEYKPGEADMRTDGRTDGQKKCHKTLTLDVASVIFFKITVIFDSLLILNFYAN